MDGDWGNILAIVSFGLAVLLFLFLAMPIQASEASPIIIEKKVYPNNTIYADCNNLQGRWLRVWDGTSMEPFLNGGNLVKVVKYNQGMELWKGNWVIYEDYNTNIIHQVIGVYSDYIVTQGLGNDVNDGHVGYNQVRYVVTGVMFCSREYGVSRTPKKQ